MTVSFLHVGILVLVLGGIALFIAAVASIFASRASRLEKVLWILVTLMFPLMGPIVWFAFGRRSVPGESR